MYVIILAVISYAVRFSCYKIYTVYESWDGHVDLSSKVIDYLSYFFILLSFSSISYEWSISWSVSNLCDLVYQIFAELTCTSIEKPLEIGGTVNFHQHHHHNIYGKPQNVIAGIFTYPPNNFLTTIHLKLSSSRYACVCHNTHKPFK